MRLLNSNRKKNLLSAGLLYTRIRCLTCVALRNPLDPRLDAILSATEITPFPTEAVQLPHIVPVMAPTDLELFLLQDPRKCNKIGAELLYFFEHIVPTHSGCHLNQACSPSLYTRHSHPNMLVPRF